LQADGQGLRKAVLKCYRIDGRTVQAGIATNRGSHSVSHLLKLFKLQIAKIEPALGIELFLLEASKWEDMQTVQEQLWAVKRSGRYRTGRTARPRGRQSRSGSYTALPACRALLARAFGKGGLIAYRGTRNNLALTIEAHTFISQTRTYSSNGPGAR
jgi:hypothetical protein